MTQVRVYYTVYEFNNVMGSERHKALQKVEFKNGTHNSFVSEEKAVQALVDDKKTYEEYVILKTFYLK